MIDEVVGIYLEFKAIPLIHHERLLHIEIPVLESRLIDGVTNIWLVNEGVRGRQIENR